MLEFMRTRRSPKLRSLVEPAPDETELREILALASRAPDHGRLVPWRFIVIRGDDRGRLGAVIGACFDADNEGAAEAPRAEARRRLAHAPLVVAVVFCPRSHQSVPEWEQVLSTGAVCMNLLNALRASGYAGLWLTEWYAFDRRVMDELGLTADERIAGFIHIGTETGERDDRARPVITDIVSVY